MKKGRGFNLGKGKFEVIEMDNLPNAGSGDDHNDFHSAIDMCSNYCSKHCPYNTGSDQSHVTGSDQSHVTGSAQCHMAWNYRQQEEDWNHIANHQIEAEEGSVSINFDNFHGFHHYFNGFKKFHLMEPLDPVDPVESQPEKDQSWVSELVNVICAKKVKRKPFRHKQVTWRTYLVDYIHFKNEVNLFVLC